jgi:2-iminobutanoate/2-iminopropanoate deaminase
MCLPRQCSPEGERYNGPVNKFHQEDRMIEPVATDRGPKAIGPYSQAIRANGFVFLSGQIPIDPKTQQIVEGNASVQTERVLENLKGVVEAAGSSMQRVVKATVFLADMNDFAEVNEVYARYFVAHPPARSTVEVSKLPRNVRVEIDLIALL